ncbi:MAG: ribonuclease P protein component [Chloroflexi bacterium]|nr:ribonuclease P protein component [Chloroflexota bacterium]
MKPDQRLRSNAEFARVRASGRSVAHPLLVVIVLPNERAQTRLGVTVSRRVGTAVVRNRVRRRLREALRARYGGLLGGHDVVLVARPAVARATWMELNAALDQSLARTGLCRSSAPGARPGAVE